MLNDSNLIKLLDTMHLFVCDGMEAGFYRYLGSGHTLEDINKLYEDRKADNPYPDWEMEAYIMQSGKNGELVITSTLTVNGWSINLRKRK